MANEIKHLLNALRIQTTAIHYTVTKILVVRSWRAIELYMVLGANKITCIPSTRFQHVFGLILVLVVSVLGINSQSAVGNLKQPVLPYHSSTKYPKSLSIGRSQLYVE